MTEAMTHDSTPHLREAVDQALRGMPELTDNARAAFTRLAEVLESSDDAVIFPAEEKMSTSQAAALLGLSRMTVVRLIERGELHAEAGSVHRRILASELDRYRSEVSRRRRSAMTELAGDINGGTPPDKIIQTR